MDTPATPSAGSARIAAARARLDETTAARAEQRRLTSRLTALGQEIAVAQAECERLDSAAASEQADVRRLEQFSPTRIWAGMRGKIADNLTREQAEAEAAAFAAARARDHLDTLHAEGASLTRERDALGDADGAFTAALAEMADAVSADSNAPADVRAIGEEARQRLDAIQYRRQAEEALAAGSDALDRLYAARKELGSAQNWSTWDTWGGGGVISSMAKHSKLDAASAKLQEASQALGVLTRELQDVDVSLPGVESPIIDNLSRGIDIWFDNIFTDFGIQDQIHQAGAQLDQTIANVELTMTALRDVHARLADA